MDVGNGACFNVKRQTEKHDPSPTGGPSHQRWWSMLPVEGQDALVRSLLEVLDMVSGNVDQSFILSAIRDRYSTELQPPTSLGLHRRVAGKITVSQLRCGFQKIFKLNYKIGFVWTLECPAFSFYLEL